jgi:hypothetical protein
MDFVQLLSNVKELNINFDNIILDLAMEEKDFIAQANRDQLWEGKTVTDEDIRPYYSEDPYFKSPKSAAAYAKWKQKITPSTRGLDVPNLYINGYFYKSILAQKKDDHIENVSNVSMGNDIISEHDNIMGLNLDHKIKLSQLVIPKFQKKLKDEITR